MGRKTFTVTGSDISVATVDTAENGFTRTVEVVCRGDGLEVSDGYHKMSEVYRHRMVLFACLLHWIKEAGNGPPVWKSKHHSDCVLPSSSLTDDLDRREMIGELEIPCCSMFEGDFVAGIGTEKGKQITYHLPLSMFNDVQVPELEKAPEYDGHNSNDVLERLRSF